MTMSIDDFEGEEIGALHWLVTNFRAPRDDSGAPEWLLRGLHQLHAAGGCDRLPNGRWVMTEDAIALAKDLDQRRAWPAVLVW